MKLFLMSLIVIMIVLLIAVLILFARRKTIIAKNTLAGLLSILIIFLIVGYYQKNELRAQDLKEVNEIQEIAEPVKEEKIEEKKEETDPLKNLVPEGYELIKVEDGDLNTIREPMTAVNISNHKDLYYLALANENAQLESISIKELAILEDAKIGESAQGFYQLIAKTFGGRTNNYNLLALNNDYSIQKNALDALTNELFTALSNGRTVKELKFEFTYANEGDWIPSAMTTTYLLDEEKITSIIDFLERPAPVEVPAPPVVVEPISEPEPEPVYEFIPEPEPVQEVQPEVNEINNDWQYSGEVTNQNNGHQRIDQNTEINNQIEVDNTQELYQEPHN